MRSWLSKKISSIRKLFTHHYFIDWGDYRKTVLVAGTGRSGTTWLTEMVNYDNRYRVIFEPLNKLKVGLVKNFTNIQYLPPENTDRAYLDPIRAILSGNVRCEWVNRMNRRFWSTQRIVKIIRGNLMLKWIKQNFPEIPIIFIMRHPCAVASSKMRLNWSTNIDNVLLQDRLIEQYFLPIKNELTKKMTDFEKHIFFWCVDNYLPLKQFAPGELHRVFYENLCISPNQEMEKVFRFLGRTGEISIPETVISKASFMSGKQHKMQSGRSASVDDWQKHITPEQAHRATMILNLFGLDQIYQEDPLPKIRDLSDLVIN